MYNYAYLCNIICAEIKPDNKSAGKLNVRGASAACITVLLVVWESLRGPKGSMWRKGTCGFWSASTPHDFPRKVFLPENHGGG